MRLALLSASCRLPGANDPEAFWKCLIAGLDQTTRVPADRFSVEAYYDPQGGAGKTCSQWGAFVDDPWCFDPERYGFRLDEASWSDPQQRMLLGCVQEALDAAKLDVRGRKVGVFVGASYAGYAERVRHHMRAGRDCPDTAIVGALDNMLSARIAHCFDLRGPAVTIDTACSSTLVALHMARRSIQTGDCDLAVVGGVHLVLSPTQHLSMGHAGALSPTGKCRPFGEAADGIVLGEGVGVFVVSSSDQAEAQGWPALTHIVGTAVANDGHSLRPMAPRPGGQVEAMRMAWAEAKLDPATAGLIEAHGTGTPVGDRVEAASIAKVFTSARRPRFLGSVKGNVGHQISAAGVASLLKVALAMQKRTVPATLFGKRPRSSLKIDQAGLVIPDRPTAWDSPHPLRAGINSFGFGGTNAHVILEEVPETNARWSVAVPPMGKCYRIEAEDRTAHRPVVNEPERHSQTLPEEQWLERIEWAEVGAASAGIWTMANSPETAREAHGGVLFEALGDDPLKAVDSVHRMARAVFPRPLRVVTRGGFARGDELSPSPAMAAAATYAAALRAEWPEGRIDAVDLEEGDSIETARTAPTGGVLLHRDGRFYRRSLVSMKAPPVCAAAPGVWLLIGGATGVGYAIARELAAPDRTLLLVGRRPLVEAPERAQRVEALRKMGAEVDYVDCDIGRVERLLDLATSQGPLVGVVHGAGVVHPGPFRERENGVLRDTFIGKLVGAVDLARALDRRKQDPTVILLSSISASEPETLGGYLAAYAAANAGLDALANARRAAGHDWIALGYSLWSDTGIGKQPDAAERMARRGLRSLDPEAAARWASRLAGRGVTNGHAHLLVVDRVPASSSRTTATSTLKPICKPGQSVDEIVRSAVAQVVGQHAADIAPSSTFVDLGLNSLAAVDLAVTLQDQGFRSVSESAFFELRTVAQLIQFLEKQEQGASPEHNSEHRPSEDEQADVDDAAHAVSPRSEHAEPGRIARAFALQSRIDSGFSPFSYLRLTFANRMDESRLERAVQRVVAHHGALRQAFHWQEERLEIVETQAPALPLHRYELSTDTALSRLENTLIDAPFALAHPPLLRAALVRDRGRSHFIVVAHHAVLDGWSLHRLMQSIWQVYQQPDAALPPEPGFSEPPTVETSHLRDYLSSVSTPWPALPGQTGRTPQGPRSAALRRLASETTGRLHQTSVEQSDTFFALATAAVTRALARWAQLDSVVLQIARARRDRDISPECVGSFADAVPVRLPADAAAGDVRRAWQQASLAGFPGLFELSSLVAAPSDGGPRVVSPFGLSLATFQADSHTGEDIEIEDVVARTATHATRVGVTMWTAGPSLGLSVNYADGWIARDSVERLADELVAELQRAADFSYFTDDVISQCRKSPHAGAIVGARSKLTYAEVEARSRRLAAGLARRQIGPGSLVAVLGESGVDAVVAILGVARAGAAWLPIDSRQPLRRTRAMLEDGKPDLVLSLAADSQIPSLHPEEVMIDGPAPQVQHRASDLAYVIFTSGSQGRPKGVAISKEAISHYLRWSLDMLQIGTEDRLLQTSSIAFDASIRQMFAPLMVGASTHPVAPEELVEPTLLLTRMEQEDITILNTSPALAAQIHRAAVQGQIKTDSLKLVAIGGEALSTSLARRCFEFGGEALRIVNLYGPTETTVNACWHEVQRDDEPIPIGTALPGYDLWIVDAEGRHSEEGELCVSGVGVCRGYLIGGHLQELTEDATISVPDERRAYRTGDRVRRRADGKLLYLGRIDDQVQIRGVRVEPAEVEGALQACEGVRLAAVSATGVAPELYLVAWVEAESENWNEDAVRAQLGARLPKEMLPRRIHRLDQLPLGPTGKLDRRLLREPMTSPEVSAPGRAPKTATEKRVAQLWARTLGRTTVRCQDDFFALGGDSLAAIDMCTKLGASGAALLYAHPRLDAFAAALDREGRAGGGVPTRSGPEAIADAPLLPAQIGFLRAHLLGPEAEVVWQSRLRLTGQLDESALQDAWVALHERHPMLRAAFRNRRMVPCVGAPPPLVLDAGDNADWPPRLDPADGWLVRGRLCRRGNARELQVVGHHLVGDGFSRVILVRELCLLHDAIASGQGASTVLPPLKTSPQEVSNYLAALPVSDRQTRYWAELYAAPFASPFPCVAGGKIKGCVRQVARGSVKRAADVIGAVYAALCARTGQRDQVIAIARSGRDVPLPGVADVVAPLAMALPIRIRTSGDQDPMLAASTAVREALANALLPHQIGTAIEPTRLPATPVFVSDLRFPVEPGNGVLRAELDTGASVLELPPGVGLFVSVNRARADESTEIELHFMARPSVLGSETLDDFADAVVTALDAVHPRQATLITYLPPRGRLHALLGTDPKKLIGKDPLELGEARCAHGICRVLALPRFADELEFDLDSLAEAVERAYRDGAQRIGLAGLLPARTEYGHALAARVSTPAAAALTTGHATTAVAVAKTLLEALRQIGARWQDARVALLGVGSIGRASLSLLLRRVGAPAELALCDLASRHKATAAFAEGLPVAARLLAAEPELPRELYDYDLIIGATSKAQVLDVAALRPGAIVVDDSFPACFDPDVARARMRVDRDVLVLGGGLMSLPGLRLHAAPRLHAVRTALDALMPPMGLPGCAVGALIDEANLGLVSPQAAAHAWDASEAAGARVPPLHLEAEAIELKVVEQVGAIRKAAVRSGINHAE